MTTLHPDFIQKGLSVPLELDGKWHEFQPPVKPAPGTYLLLTSLLGKLDPADRPSTNFGVSIMRYKLVNGVLVPDLVDNGTAWDVAVTQDLLTSTWAATWPAKAVVSTTYPAYGPWYRGDGGSAILTQRILKFLLQRSS